MSFAPEPGRWVLVDSGPLYAMVDTDDGHHDRARADVGRLSRDRLRPLVVYPTLLEAYSLILRRLGPETAQRWLGEIREGVPSVAPRARHYESASDLLARFSDQRISFFDALLAEMANVLELPVWTYDSDFDVMGIAVWR